MNDLEKQYFAALSESRSKDADALDRPNLRGVKKSIVDKYSDQAHFVYELIQNADDAGATEATFDVYEDRLVFIHNGTRNFHVSNPDTEGEDYDNHTLGDINAITGIGLSSKPDTNKKGNAIGKFGMGFKSIFQYTSTPEIYDPNVSFRIRRQIVPELIDHDFPGRKGNETVFVFPFDNREAKRPALDSLEKLHSLLFPTLFLNNLQVITFNHGDEIGEYRKRIVEALTLEDDDQTTTCLRIEHTKAARSGDEVERLLLFSRTDEENHRYSVGFKLGADGGLEPADYKAFCFFPTKHETRLKFLIHAPFLLTDSRETIKEFEDHNKDMIAKLADLEYDALVHMRDMRTPKRLRLVDDNILSVVPVGGWGDADFFKAFWLKTARCFSMERILPTSNAYVSRADAYWPVSKQISEVFPDDKLQALYEDGDIHWVFRSKWNDSDLEDSISDFISECTAESPTEVALLDRITPSFVESQPLSWLSGFYRWIDEGESRRRKARKLPVFLDIHGRACAAFDEKDRPALFLPLDGEIDGEYTTVHPDLLKDECAVALLTRYKASEPDKAAHFRWIIDKKLPSADLDSLDQYLKPLFEYYFTLPSGEKTELRNAINSATGFRALNCKTQTASLEPARELYFPTQDLVSFFADCEALYFVDEEHYVALVGEGFREDVHEFFQAVGAREVPRIRDVRLSWEEAHRLDVNWHYASHSREWTEKQIDGFHEAFSRFEEEFDVANKRVHSKAIWLQLQRVSESLKSDRHDSFLFYSRRDLKEKLQGEYKYFYRTTHWQSFDSRILTRIRETKWVFGEDGAFHRPGDLDTRSLSDDYAEFGSVLHSFLGICEYVEPVEEPSAEELARDALSSEDKEMLELGKAAKEAGLTKEVLEAKVRENEQLKEKLRQMELENARLAKTVAGASGNSDIARNEGREGCRRESVADGDSRDVPDCEVACTGADSTSCAGSNRGGLPQGRSVEGGGDCDETLDDPTKPVYVQAHRRSRPIRGTASGRIFEAVESYMSAEMREAPPLPDPFNDDDDDEQIPRAIDFGKRLREREQREAREIASIEHGEELQQKAEGADRYSFGWFKAMLDIEKLGNEKDSAERREITIHFTRIEREPGTERTFVLKHPSRSLPQWLEELSGIALDLVFDKDMRVVIEVMSVHSYNLRVKLKSASPLEGVDLSTLREATVSARSPDFLLSYLRDGLFALPFEDGKNLRMDLTENLEFIFGPPGTGKTTYLAEKRILPLMRRKDGLKVLVLAPTNKAADVLASRVIERGGVEACSNWLVRFGATGDENLERTGVCKGKDVDLASYDRVVVVTTIARFPYDSYLPGNAAPQKLVEHDWDYIIIDEASMIPLVNIIYPLFRKERAHFIIAGDPFQIEPIISNNLWRDENIFTMVGLESFSEPKTQPRNYPVEKLTTQYRSVPAIGKIFSSYRYGGILTHARTAESIRPINAAGFPELRPLSIVKFPVSPYESVYRAKRLGAKGGSAYQIYSALLAFELVSGFASRIEPQEKPFRIGVISPYRAQASLVQRLLESQHFPSYIQASASTVHGFQGDECEMIVALFNPPPGLSGRKGTFINKKNIINVAVSRARDYLVVLMPDDATENLGNMVEVRKIEALMRTDPDNLIVYEAKSIEKTLLGNQTFIEGNAFSTGHQMVNVYGAPERRYEIRADEGAVDVQLHLADGADSSESNSGRMDSGGAVAESSLDDPTLAEGFAKIVLFHHREGLTFSAEDVESMEVCYGHKLTSDVRALLERKLFMRSDGVWFHPEAVMSELEQKNLAEYARRGLLQQTPVALNWMLKSRMKFMEDPKDLRGFFRYVKAKFGVVS